MKIICCKHSAARTAVKQAADTGAMFKTLKYLPRQIDTPTAGNNSIHHYLEQKINSMPSSTQPSNSKQILKLPSHKKKAILATVSKMPIATSRAYSEAIIKKAFVVNSQLDPTYKAVPSFTGLTNTYRGDIKGTCLENKESLFSESYEEVYMTGMVSKNTLDLLNVPKDVNVNGEIVDCDTGIQLENRQRAKTFSSLAQIEARRDLIFSKRMDLFKKEEKLYLFEDEEHRLNRMCENRLARMYKEYTKVQTTVEPPSDETSFLLFSELCDKLSSNMINQFTVKILKAEIRAFVRVWSKAVVRGGRIVYQSVPNLKTELIKRMFELHSADALSRQYPTYPLKQMRS